jgi:hypothetical protein
MPKVAKTMLERDTNLTWNVKGLRICIY